MKYILGADIGGTTVKLGLFDEGGNLADKWEINTNKQDKGKWIPNDIADAINKKLEEKAIGKEDILGMGIGVPGPVTSDGIVHSCANLGWGEMNVNKKFSEVTGLRCFSGNDANVAALGETWFGGGKGCKNIVMVTLGTGVGGGIVIDGRIHAGSHGAAGEIGHITVNSKEARPCGCGGRGHLEQYASATGIANIATEMIKTHKDSSLCEIGGKLTAKDVFDAAKAGDKTALEVLDVFAIMLNKALSHISATVDPDCFIIGGGVSAAGDFLINLLKKRFGTNMLEALRAIDIRLATLGNDAGIYGCARMVLNESK